MLLKNQTSRSGPFTFSHGRDFKVASDSIKEQLSRFVDPDRRGKFSVAFADFMRAANPSSEFRTYRAEIERDPVAAIRGLVSPFLRYGMQGEFDVWLRSLRK